MAFDIYEMQLHELGIVCGNVSVFRVPGGWIYNKTFVPFNGEFLIKQIRSKTDICTRCNGIGHKSDHHGGAEVCDKCGGSGKLSSMRIYD